MAPTRRPPIRTGCSTATRPRRPGATHGPLPRHAAPHTEGLATGPAGDHVRLIIHPYEPRAADGRPRSGWNKHHFPPLRGQSGTPSPPVASLLLTRRWAGRLIGRQSMISRRKPEGRRPPGLHLSGVDRPPRTSSMSPRCPPFPQSPRGPEVVQTIERRRPCVVNGRRGFPRRRCRPRTAEPSRGSDPSALAARRSAAPPEPQELGE